MTWTYFLISMISFPLIAQAEAKRFIIQTGTNIDDSRFDGLSIDFSVINDGKNEWLHDFWLVYQRPRGSSQESFGPIKQYHVKGFFKGVLADPKDLKLLEPVFVIELDQDLSVPSLARKSQIKNSLISRIVLYPDQGFALLLRSPEDSIEPLPKMFHLDTQLDTESSKTHLSLMASGLSPEDPLNLLHSDHYFEECRESVQELAARRKRIKDSLKRAKFEPGH